MSDLDQFARRGMRAGAAAMAELERLEREAGASNVPQLNFNVADGQMTVTIARPLSLPVTASVPLLDFFDLSARALIEWNKQLRAAQDMARQHMAQLTPEQLAELAGAHHGRG